jgi:hypothetical protein
MSRHDEDIASDYADWSGDDGDDGDDRYEEYKDAVAMGYIWPDGTQREPPEPDWSAREYAEHCEEMHGGGACDCPMVPLEAASPGDPGYSDEPPF